MALNYNKKGLPCFTASVSVWNGKHTDIIAGGQMLEEVVEFLSDNALYMEIVRLWRANHLNDMWPGTPEQMKALEAWRPSANYTYKGACEHLDSIGLLTVTHDGAPFTYGHGWVYQPITEEDLESIKRIMTLGEGR